MFTAAADNISSNDNMVMFSCTQRATMHHQPKWLLFHIFFKTMMKDYSKVWITEPSICRFCPACSDSKTKGLLSLNTGRAPRVVQSNVQLPGHIYNMNHSCLLYHQLLHSKYRILNSVPGRYSTISKGETDNLYFLSKCARLHIQCGWNSILNNVGVVFFKSLPMHVRKIENVTRYRKPGTQFLNSDRNARKEECAGVDWLEQFV